MEQINFWQSAFLYIYRPNLINRRFIGAKILYAWSMESSDNLSISDIESRELWENTSIQILQDRLTLILKQETIDEKHIIKDTFPILLLRKLFRKQSLKALRNDKDPNSSSQFNDTEYDLIVLFPSSNLFILIAINFDEADHTIRLQTVDSLSYSIALESSKLSIRYLFGNVSNNFWLENVCKPKLEQWMRGSSSDSSSALQGSIKMISVENYCANYNRLKAKYSLKLLDIWSTVEKTDPIKFIFEDIAIAAYLITMWEEEHEKLNLPDRQTFADIGCGNGLLVYILSGEGYMGYGVDLRKRNIWSHYEPTVNLIEMQIDTFDDVSIASLPPADWMIGNHSDELTPWIIYIASSFSPQTRAFLLPCCCYDFDGHKFQRTIDPDKSQYQCYINFLQTMAEKFGFKCFRDKLRIPSTKRICVVCYGRNYATNDIESIEQEMKAKRKAIVRERLQIRASLRLRDKQEAVRNCTRIDVQIKSKIIEQLTTRLLQPQFENGFTLAQAIRLLDDESREQLKKQCGGLQTFVRNHRHIFTISEFRIRFQCKQQLRAKEGKPYMRTKECWFFRHHPQGCELSDTECAYKH